MADEDKIKKTKSTKVKKKERKTNQKEKEGTCGKVDKSQDDSLFNLEDVTDLGGKKADYEDLLKINADEELETENIVGGDTDNLKTEVERFIQTMGFSLLASKNTNVVKKDTSVAKADTSVVNKDTSVVKDATNVKYKKSPAERECIAQELNEAPAVKEKKKKSAEKTPTLFKCLEYKKHDNLLLKNAVPWYALTSAIPKCKSVLDESEIDSLYTVANQYWQTEVDIYQKLKDNNRSSDAKWLRTVLKSGTLSDRVAALTMLSQESPIHCMQVLEQLINMSKKKARREALIAIDSLRHIWIADLLPDYKLRKFNEFPIEQLNEYAKSNSHQEKVKLLVTMIFEDHLKKVYKEFLDILENFSKDALCDIRNKVLGIIYELLQMKPEGEQALLSILVNKLGDPERKVASKASYLLCELVAKHPNMKAIVITDVERMMYRPNMSFKAQYYAICFLNQIVLSHEEKNVASKLVSIYFSFFKVVAKSDSSQNKLLSGLLTGVNRAYPYVEGMHETYDDQLNTLFRLSHSKHLMTSVQAFMLIYQVMESRQTVSDRYYKALYEKVLHPDVSKSTKHTMLLNLLFKSMKNDPVLKRVKSFIKRLLQMSSQYDPSLLCGILFLISEVIKGNPGINSMMLQPEEQDEEEHFVDAAPEEESNKLREDDEDCENKEPTGCKNEGATKESKGKASWTFINENNNVSGYNIKHRNPLYARAEETCLWEIVPLLSHFHPSVTHFATTVVNGKEIEYHGDPSEDFTLISFLERFMYRNPKQKEVQHGNSLMQRKEYSQRLKEQPVNSKQFLQKSEENVPHDQVFFHRYFKQKMMDQELKEEEKEESFDPDMDDVDDIDFAGEMKRDGAVKKKLQGKNKNKTDESASESEEEEDESSFSYDNIDDESSDEDQAKESNFSDKDYEKALFENLDSDGESIENEENKDDDEDVGMDPMFAAAEEFSHLLESGGDQSADGVHHKQRAWEEKQEQKPWKFNKLNRNNKTRNKRNTTSENKTTKRKRNFTSENRNIKKRKVKK